jgi:uncharacterized repeat protein (TIGR01451 family)
LFAVAALVVGFSTVGLTPQALAEKGFDDGVNTAATTATITSAGPLNNIYLGSQLNCQADHTGDTSHEFFGGVPGACATLIVVNGTLFGPASIPAGGSAAPRTTYTEVSQSAVTGTGSAADPFKVVTVVDAGSTGVRLTQTDTYVVGTEIYRTDVQVQNTGNSSANIILYRAGDCFLQNSDAGFGDLLSNGSVGCRGSDDGGQTPNTRIEQWIPLTGGSSAFESGFNTVWARIGSQQTFPNTCLCDQYLDNGAGLSWSGTLAANAGATYSHLTVFSPTGVTGPFLEKTAAFDNAPASGTDSYTITIHNPTGSDVTLNSIVDHLPDGFSYVPGSTRGITTSEPTTNGQDVTWTGSFVVPAAGTVDLTFDVVVSAQPGTYFNSADGSATAQLVTGTDHVAPITVVLQNPSFTG